MKLFVDLEDKKWFIYLFEFLFYMSSITGFVFLFYKNYYVLPVIFIFWLLFIIFPYRYLFEKRNIEHAFDDFCNLIDNPIDDLKHKIHGMKIFGKTIYLPKWLMRGSGEQDK
jgi:hypothetical protein